MSTPRNTLQEILDAGPGQGEYAGDWNDSIHTDLSLPDTERQKKEEETSTFNNRQNLQLWTSKLSWKQVPGTQASASPETYTSGSDIDQNYDERNTVFQHTPATPADSAVVDSLFTEPDPAAFTPSVQKGDDLQSERVWLTKPVDSMWSVRSSYHGILGTAPEYTQARRILVAHVREHPEAIVQTSQEEYSHLRVAEHMDMDFGFSDSYFNYMDVSPKDHVSETPTVKKEQQDPVKYNHDTTDNERFFERGLHQTITRPETQRNITPYAAAI